MLSSLRGLLALMLGLAACLLLPLTLVANWADELVTDTDAYVAAVAPLADDPAVQDAAAQRIRAGVLDGIDPRVERLLGAEGRTGLDRASRQVVRSDAFAGAWEAGNEVAHERLLAALRSPNAGDEDVSIPLSRLADAVVRQVVPAGAGVEVPVPDVAVTLLPAEDVRAARAAYDRLVAADAWLPWATAGAAALCLLVAVRRLRALAWLGVGAAVAGAGSVGLLILVRRSYVASASGSPAPQPVRLAVWDALTESLRHDGLLTAAVGAAVAVVAGVAALLARRAR